MAAPSQLSTPHCLCSPTKTQDHLSWTHNMKSTLHLSTAAHEKTCRYSLFLNLLLMAALGRKPWLKLSFERSWATYISETGKMKYWSEISNRLRRKWKWMFCFPTGELPGDMGMTVILILTGSCSCGPVYDIYRTEARERLIISQWRVHFLLDNQQTKKYMQDASLYTAVPSTHICFHIYQNNLLKPTSLQQIIWVSCPVSLKLYGLHVAHYSVIQASVWAA